MIRLLDPFDVDCFRRIRLEALRAEPAAYASSVEDFEPLTDDELSRRLAAMPVFVAFADEEPVGIIGLLRQTSSRMAHRATIVMVYVRKNLRGQGIAQALLSSVIAHARDRGLRQLELAVRADNPAATRFYEKAGFRAIGRIPGGFVDGDTEIDEVLMALRL